MQSEKLASRGLPRTLSPEEIEEIKQFGSME
jgi:hypothetical protein